MLGEKDWRPLAYQVEKIAWQQFGVLPLAGTSESAVEIIEVRSPAQSLNLNERANSVVTPIGMNCPKLITLHQRGTDGRRCVQAPPHAPQWPVCFFVLNDDCSPLVAHHAASPRYQHPLTRCQQETGAKEERRGLLISVAANRTSRRIRAQTPHNAKGLGSITETGR